MIRVLTLLLILAAGPAFATQDGWPALYDVSGVASDDVLNIRSEPGAAGDVIGTLRPDAKDIEVIRANDPQTWGLVNTGEGSGWVSLAFMERHPGNWDGSFPEIRQCFGTEPFWSLAYDPPEIVFSAPDMPPRAGLISGLYSSLSRRDSFAYSGSFFPAETGERVVQLFVQTESCSDGMSDRQYGISVQMLLRQPTAEGDNSGTGLYSGCCSIQPPAR